MSESEMRSGRVLELAEEFLERYRNGERPPLKEYTDRHPDLAGEIREVFPAMAMMENIAVADSSLEGGEEEAKPKKPAESTLTQLGDYRIIRVIGHGGMGVVYEAEQVSLGRHVALKVLPNQALADEKHKRRFEREAKAAAKLHHTNIVPVFGVGEHEGLPYYVMQYIQGLGLDVVLDELNHMQPGGERTPTGGLPTAGEIRISRRDEAAAEMARSLMTGAFRKSEDSSDADRTQAPATVAATVDQAARDLPRPKLPAPSSMSNASHSGSFTVSSSSITLPGASGTGKRSGGRQQSYWQSVANIGRQVAEALEYAHKQGVLHRDVKPSNLLLDLRGTVWVTDFGLAKVAGPGGDNLTHTGDILGTLRYMPPEAFEGKSDARSDVYSLGLTMYELIAMRPAYEEKDRNKLIKRVTTGEPAPLHKVNRDAPRDLVTIIQKAIDRDPHRRYATADDMASDLQRFLDDEPILARRQTRVERYWRWARHNPGMAILGGVLTAVLLIATLASLIVAGRMATLARDSAQAAEDERKARLDADVARDLAAVEQEKSENAKRDADGSRKRAELALAKAEENFAKARAAVNDYLTAVSEDERLKSPGLQGLRVQLLQSALQFYQQFLKERGNDPTLRRELAGVYLKVSEIYRDLGQTAPANRTAAEARKLYEALVRESPDDVALKHGWAMALSRTGQAFQAISIVEKIINPDDPKYHADLGELYNTVAMSNNSANKVTSTELEYLRKSLAVRERLVRLRPDDPEAHLGLSASLNNIAIRLKDGREAEAFALLQRSHDEDEIAYRLRPGHLLTARYITIGLGNLANYAKKLGETDAGLAAHRRRVEILDRRARDNPTVPGFGTDLVAGFRLYLSELHDAGRLDEAARVAEKARVRIGELAEESSAYFNQVVSFHLAAYALAAARSKANPNAADAETEAAAAIDALRHHALSGWRDTKSLQANDSVRLLRERPDFKAFLNRIEELKTAEAKTQPPTPLAEKLAARKTILTTLEAIAGPQPHSRLVRRVLAQARQDLAQTLLESGDVENARLAFDDALLTRQHLVQEAPSNEQLRADLAQSQSAAGDLYAAAGKLADAERTWNKALATLEEGLKSNPNSVPYQGALAERLLHIAIQESNFGLWDRAAVRLRQALAMRSTTLPMYWNFIAMIGAENRDRDLQRAAVDLAGPATDVVGDNGLFRIRSLTTPRELPPEHLKAVERLSTNYGQNPWHDIRWVRALVYYRLGKIDRASQLIADRPPQETDWPQLPLAALIHHRQGRAAEAAETLRRADAQMEAWHKNMLETDQAKWSPVWDAFLHFRQIQAEAHETIHGKPRPDSPYERLLRGRIHFALEEHDKGEAEFAAAVEIRPSDGDVWLARSRLYGKVGQNERMAADLARVQKLKSDDPRTWIETGRTLAEIGEHEKADAAFARASKVGNGELNRFLESGWWVVGPYQDSLHQSSPPERNLDPSKPVAAIGDKGAMKWKSVPTNAPNGSILTERLSGGSQTNGTYYLSTFVYAERDRTATMVLRCSGDARLWVNGRIVLDSVADWKFSPGDDIRIPISLKAGRNALLIKTRHTRKSHNWCECQFTDSPIRAAFDRHRAELCVDAAAAFAEAERRGQMDEYRYRTWIVCLLATGQDAEARRAFAELSKRPDAGGASGAGIDFLPPAKTPDRERRLAAARKFVSEGPNDVWRHHQLANALLRNGEFTEAETNARKAIDADQPYCRALLAVILHYQGKADEATKALAAAEKTYARLVKDALTENRYRSNSWSDEGTLFLAARREARTVILGHDPGPSADEKALLARGTLRAAQLDKIEDAYARLVAEDPASPRHLIDHARRLGELGAWDDAAKAFEKVAQSAAKDAQVWKERGRAYADLRKWDQSAADFDAAIELSGASALAAIVRNEKVFAAVANRRPVDRQLWAARLDYAGRAGLWPEAAQAIVKLTEFDPGDHYLWHVRAALPLELGDMEQFRADCREMMTRFGQTTDPLIAQRIAHSCFMAPGGVDDPAVVLEMLRNAGKKEDIPDWRFASDVDSWRALALAMGYYRTGQFERSIKTLAPLSRTQIFLDVMVMTVRSMAQSKAGQVDAARQSLAEARQVMMREIRPGEGESQWGWHNWLQADLLLREAATLIPSTPSHIADAGLAAEEQTIRRDRKFRSDSLTTKSALAQLRIDIGQRTKAEAELRDILAQRKTIAAEEPGNIDYQIEWATAHEYLGQCLVALGRIDDGLKETQAAVVLLERSAAQNPKAARFQVNLASTLFRIAEQHWKAKRLTEGQQAWKRALTYLTSVQDAAAKDPAIETTAVKMELLAARAYADLDLWPEAIGHYRRAFAKNPVAGKLDERYYYAALLALTGRDEEYRDYSSRVFQRDASLLRDRWLARALVFRPGPPPGPDEIVKLVQRTRAESNNDPWAIPEVAIAQLRAGQIDAARKTLAEFEAISKREWQFGWPAIAILRHKSGQIDEAKEWVRKIEAWYAEVWESHFARNGDGLTTNNLFHWGFFAALRQEAIETVTGKPAPPDAWLFLNRGRMLAKLGEKSKAEGEFQAAVAARPDDIRILFARARIYESLGRHAEAKADRAKANEAAERVLSTDPLNSAAAGIVATRILENGAPKWSTLPPRSANSDRGTPLEVLPDHSVFAGRSLSKDDVYVVEFEAPGPITAFRLEAMADKRLPSGGPGRSENGNFVLTDLRLQVKGRDVALTRAFADFSQSTGGSFPVTDAIDADPNTGWAINPQVGKSHWAVFVPEAPVGGSEKVRCSIRLAFQSSQYGDHLLGRFRISLTSDPPGSSDEAWFPSASSPLARVAAAHLATGRPRRAVEHLTKPAVGKSLAQPADWLVLALAHARLSELESARKACAEAAKRFGRDGVDGGLRPLLRQVVVALGENDAVIQSLLVAAGGTLPESLDEAVRKDPNNRDAYRNRADWYAYRGRWTEAIADLDELVRREGDSLDAMRLGVLLCYSGEADRYRRHCKTMLERWGKSNEVFDADRVLKVTILQADPTAELMGLKRLAIRAIANDESKADRWCLFAKGLYDFRTGDFDGALAAARLSRERSGGHAPLITLDLILEAMAQKRDPEAARRILRLAKTGLDRFLPGVDGGDWADYLFARLLYREAEALLPKQAEQK